jgi:hypothetical protein
MVPPIPTPAPTQAPIIDLLGDDDGFTPYVQAPNIQSTLDDDFGHFQEASINSPKQVPLPTTT